MNQVKYYILDDNKEIIETDMMTWANFFESSPMRIIKQETTSDYVVSTVFIGMDHRFFADGSPLLFETMVFDNLDREVWVSCCATYAEAEKQHDYGLRHITELERMGK